MNYNEFLKLTHKIPCVFLPNFVVFDIVEEIIFSKNSKYENLTPKAQGYFGAKPLKITPF
jgi:hypothetical protein